MTMTVKQLKIVLNEADEDYEVLADSMSIKDIVVYNPQERTFEIRTQMNLE